MLRSSVLAIIAMSSLLLPLLALAAAKPTEGSPAPAFTLPNQEGTPVSLKDLRGKWVVLYFYPKDFTSGCTIEAHNFERDIKQYEAKNAEILGVSLDSVDSHKQFCVKEGLNFKLLSDADGKVSNEYDTMAEGGKYAARNTYLIDPQGKIAKVYTGVNPNKHSEEVLADIDRLAQK